MNGKWEKEDYINLLQKIKAYVDPKYKEFSQKLIPNNEEILGIRLPQLRIFAKDIANDDWQSYFNVAQNDSHEEILLQGLVIGYIRYNKGNFNDILKLIETFIPKINNWAVCDTFCAGLKIIKKNKKQMFEFLVPYIESSEEFKQRFAVVILMDYFINEEYIDKLFIIFNSIKSDKYYTNMAIAWALSFCFIKFEEKTFIYLNNNNLNNFTYNKALQKIIESLRISEDTKANVRKMKRIKNSI